MDISSVISKLKKKQNGGREKSMAFESFCQISWFFQIRPLFQYIGRRQKEIPCHPKWLTAVRSDVPLGKSVAKDFLDTIQRSLTMEWRIFFFY